MDYKIQENPENHYWDRLFNTCINSAEIQALASTYEPLTQQLFNQSCINASVKMGLLFGRMSNSEDPAADAKIGISKQSADLRAEWAKKSLEQHESVEVSVQFLAPFVKFKEFVL